MNHPPLSTNIFTKVYYWLIREQCYICDIQNEGLLCRSCAKHLTRNRTLCVSCARPMSSLVELCGHCQTNTPSFQNVIAPLVYEGLTRAMITKAKFEDQAHLLRPLTQILAATLINELDLTKSWHWTVIPTGKQSLLERGFCQTSLIRQLLKNPIRNASGKPFKIFNITRSFERPAQHSLNKADRYRLSHKTFNVPQPAPEYVVLIDDLITTGSTIEACSKALKKAGTKQVVIAALARTPAQSSDYR